MDAGRGDVCGLDDELFCESPVELIVCHVVLPPAHSRVVP
jgi:hypothetical protein